MANYTAWKLLGRSCYHGFSIKRKQVLYYIKKYEGRLKPRNPLRDFETDRREIIFKKDCPLDAIVIWV